MPQTVVLSDLPVEMLEAVLMRTFLMLYSTGFQNSPAKSRSSERRAYRVLSSVCWCWWQTLAGWPQSPTGHWVKHQLKKLIQRSCRPFCRLTQMQDVHKLVEEYGEILGLAQLHDAVYIVGRWSPAVLKFSLVTHEQLDLVEILGWPLDIAACQQNFLLYIADCERRCVWRKSEDGSDVQMIQCKLPALMAKDRSTDAFTRPYTLSVTSTRLLVTLRDTHQLIQFDAVGDELRRVQLPNDMEQRHAVESPTGTFIVSLYNTQLKQGQVAEVNTGGEVLRQFSGSRLPPLGGPPHIAVDSHGNIFVADRDNCRILLLDARLSLRRVIIDEHQLNYKQPRRLCYREQSGQLLVALDTDVIVFDVLQS